jgi:hypothetical protein
MGLRNAVPLQGLVGYLNFSQGKPDPRFQKQLNEAFHWLVRQGSKEPWQALFEALRDELTRLRDSGTAGFEDVTQAARVLPLGLTQVLRAYQRHHAVLLVHQPESDLFQPFFLARVLEAVLKQGAPWDEEERIVRGTLAQLNDFVGYRPLALLETRPEGEPYDHERFRPVPLFLRGAGVASGRYHALISTALEILAATDRVILADAGFDLALLDELALDVRAYDHGHPVNRRPNYVFGEWDPSHLDGQGRYRRFVVRQITLDALLDRVDHRGTFDPAELLREAAAVLAGTMLMAAGVTGNSPTAYDSSVSLGTLLPRIARYRDGFYEGFLRRIQAPHGERLREESQRLRQPFGAARQHVNQYLARQRAIQLQQKHLALLFANIGYPEASREEAARIPAVGTRLLTEIIGRQTTVQLLLERSAKENATSFLQEAARLLPEAEDWVRRGIACGALADPWNILGFQGLFPLSSAREDAVRDPRIDELVGIMARQFSLYSHFLSEAAAAGEAMLVPTIRQGLRRLASWWDQFASAEVSDVLRVHGGEAADSAELVATALERWRERSEAPADFNFWRRQSEAFRSPKGFAVVVETLLRKQDFRAAQGLLMSWLSQAEQVPLDDGQHSFHLLAVHWVRAWQNRSAGDQAESWTLLRRFFEQLEANAEEFWDVPELETVHSEHKAGQDDVYGAAYEDVVYRDSTQDDEEGSVIEGQPREAFSLEEESPPLKRRLHFLATLARLWLFACRGWPEQSVPPDAAPDLRNWLAQARDNRERLLALLDAIHQSPIPDPLGSEESLVEYDRRRVIKEDLQYAVIGTCLDTELAMQALEGELGSIPEAKPGRQARPAWGAEVLALERALRVGDSDRVRAALQAFLERFREEPLTYTPLADGGGPRQILRTRLAQTVLRGVLASLPRLGLLRETVELLEAARDQEEARLAPAPRVSEFNHLFEAAFQPTVECVVDSAADWTREQEPDEALMDVLERLTTPFMTLWVERSQTLQVSSLEALRSDSDWEALRSFIQRYGGDLFHARFMTLANLRGILHHGCANYLDDLSAQEDPLHPVRLLKELGGRIRREDAVRWLEFVLRAVADNYEEYKDYKTTTTQSDYGDRLHILLDFLRLKANYDRHAWHFRPLLLIHDVLARRGRATAARLWEETFVRFTQELADRHLDELRRLEQGHGIKLRSVADRLEERFVKPLALDRWCSLIGPALKEAQGPGPYSAFQTLAEELRHQAESPSGAGLDVPHWLLRLEQELQRTRVDQSELGVPTESLFRTPRTKLSRDAILDQLDEEETSSESEA